MTLALFGGAVELAQANHGQFQFAGHGLHAPADLADLHLPGLDAAQEILDQAENKIFHIAQQVETGQVESHHDLIRQTMEMLEANEGKTLTDEIVK